MEEVFDLDPFDLIQLDEVVVPQIFLNLLNQKILSNIQVLRLKLSALLGDDVHAELLLPVLGRQLITQAESEDFTLGLLVGQSRGDQPSFSLSCILCCK